MYIYVSASRLKERNVQHVKIKDVTTLHDIYEFKEQIGKGGFGTVMSVVERNTEKDWAMKIVSKSAAGAKLTAVKRELHILKMVEHPHIIYLEKVYESSNKIYMLLERCYGVLENLYKTQKTFTEAEVRKIVKALASAVAYLHKNDIVHRDLKMENILMAKNPSDPEDNLYIKLSDFGLSIVKSGSGYENMLHDCCGTVTYMAPEIITKQTYSHQCDVWAMGVLTYMLLGGHYPFFSTNEQALTMMICKQEPSFIGFTASPEAINLVTKMLAKNPALRITAAEIAHHAWMAGKSMAHDLPENVLDMMRLWRSELMLPIGDECDWMSTNVMAPNKQPHLTIKPSHTDLDKRNYSKNIVAAEDAHEKENTREDHGAASSTAFRQFKEDHGAASSTAFRQSMNIPVKNIKFDRTRNEAGAKTMQGQRAARGAGGKRAGAIDEHAGRGSDPSPDLNAGSRPSRFPASDKTAATSRKDDTTNAKT